MIDLRLLGGLTIDGPELSPIAPTRRRGPLALLALVATAAPASVARDEAVALLWPDSDPERASKSLDQTLLWLRQDLGDDLFLPETDGGLRLDPTKLTVDLWVFRGALEREAPADAVEVYGGPFLAEFRLPGLDEFSRWVETERNTAERQYSDALDTLARGAEAEGNYEDAVSWRRRQAAVDPPNPRSALALLRALTAAGDRRGALEYARVYENIVGPQRGAELDPDVTDFIASLSRELPEVETREPAKDGPTEPEEPQEVEANGLEKPEEPRESPVEPTAAPPDQDAASEPTARQSRGFKAPGRWLFAAAVVVALAVLIDRSPILRGSGHHTPASSPPANVVVLGSGMKSSAGRDVSNRLVSCRGPACPKGSLPQNAYVVPMNGAYAPPVAGTRFIAPVQNGTTISAPGYDCCTTATFENDFKLPADAVSATISVSVLADNRASVTINGVEFGRQPDSMATSNFAGPPQTFSTTFPPEPSGLNRLHVTLWDGGGGLGLEYNAVVTYVVARDSMSS